MHPRNCFSPMCFIQCVSPMFFSNVFHPVCFIPCVSSNLFLLLHVRQVFFHSNREHNLFKKCFYILNSYTIKNFNFRFIFVFIRTMFDLFVPTYFWIFFCCTLESINGVFGSWFLNMKMIIFKYQKDRKPLPQLQSWKQKIWDITVNLNLVALWQALIILYQTWTNVC